MGDPRLDTFRRIPLFAGCSDEGLQRIVELATEAEVPAGHVLIQPGLEGSGFFVLEEGTVTVEAHDHPAELGPGEFFGELALLTPEAVRSARVRATTPVRFLAISRRDFESLLEGEPKMALAMLRTLAHRLAVAAHG
ncbi:MAG TPA: cyclic nucleotide-binding domain-containing protein [Actinomycetota bacterium]